MWDDLNTNLGREYLPGPCLTVDEQLMPWRGRCSFLQYLPSKPGDPYLGRKGRPSAAGEKNIGRNTAIRLIEPYFGSGRNLTTDNFFIDKVLSYHLLKNGVTLVGTVRRDKRFLPHDFQKGTGMSKGDAMFAFTKTTICAYKSNIKKHVVVLNTMHHSADRGTTNKPEVVESYNSTKGGVDSMDQMCHKFTTKRKTNRWPMLLFYDMLDLASIDSIVCWRKTFPGNTLSKKDMRAQFNIAIGPIGIGSTSTREAKLDLPSALVDLLAEEEVGAVRRRKVYGRLYSGGYAREGGARWYGHRC
ncbi:hypothetical protein RRG08_062802 [Elysia crispata]|uniref:PiggyBac transposable element-derived protein domain-containing protein n=1 Tax=Elysia crispata TaxID=231223 RepID=A0AAE1A080_9GAST|nr:hypothetical protein RRG08_062802 [Elysia crispata]